jgi:hypothetical protein
VALPSMYNIYLFISLFHIGSRGACAFIVLQSCHETSSIFYVIKLPNLYYPNTLLSGLIRALQGLTLIQEIVITLVAAVAGKFR